MRFGHRHTRLLRPLQGALLQAQGIHPGVNASDVFFLNAFDGFPSPIDFPHQGIEAGRKLRGRRRDRPFAFDLQGDWHADGITVFEPLNEHDVGRIADPCDVGVIEVFKAKPIGIFIADHHLPFALVACTIPLRRLLLDLHDLSPKPAGVVDPGLAAFLKLDLCYPCGPKGSQTVDDNETDEIHDHKQTNGQAHRRQPHKWLARRAA